MRCTCGSPEYRVLNCREPASSYILVTCRQCGLWRTFPSPSVETLDTAYADNYGPHQPAGPGRHGSGWRRVWVVPDLPRGSRVLEIGPGSGRFVAYGQARGWIMVTLNGVGAAERYTPPAGGFDAVVGWQVLEHCLDPTAVLRMAAVALRPRGQLLLSTPNVRSVGRWLFGARWSDWQIPLHLWHFSPTTLRRLVTRAGFRVERVAHQRIFKGVSGRASDVLGAVVAACRVSERITLVASR